MLLDERLFEDYKEDLDCEKTPKGKKSKAEFAGDPTANMTRDEYIDWLIAVKGYNKKSAESTADMFYESLKEDIDNKKICIDNLTTNQIEKLPNRFLCVSRLPGLSFYSPVFDVVSKEDLIKNPKKCFYIDSYWGYASPREVYIATPSQLEEYENNQIQNIKYSVSKYKPYLIYYDISLSNESLKEDFDDVVDIVLPNSDEEIVIPTAPEIATIPEGPKTGEEIGQSSMLLDAIAACAKTIDSYNIIKTNLTDPKMIEVVEGIASQETNILGKLQGLLKEVSPNASEIMYGATDVDSALTEDLDESLNKDLNEGRFDTIDLAEWEDNMTERKGIIVNSIYTVFKKVPESKDFVLRVAKDCRNTFDNVAYNIESSMNESLKEDYDEFEDQMGEEDGWDRWDVESSRDDWDSDEDQYTDNFDSSYLEHLDPMTGKLKVEAWAPPVEQSDVNNMANANMPDMIIPDDLDVDDDFEDPEEGWH